MSDSRTLAPLPYEFLPPVPSFTLAGAELTDGGPLPRAQQHHAFGIGGGNRSPDLRWSGFPAATGGFAVTCFDPDASTGSGFWHWLLMGIPAHVTALAPGVGSGTTPVPPGAFHVRNDFGRGEFGGAALRSGQGPHRYVFAVHALDEALTRTPEPASAAMAGALITFHTIARAVLVCRHGTPTG